MDEKEVNRIDTEVSKLTLDRRGEMFAARIVVLDAVRRSGVVGQTDSALRDDLQTVTKLGCVPQDLTEQRFATVSSIDVGMINGRDACFKTGIDDLPNGSGTLGRRRRWVVHDTPGSPCNSGDLGAVG